MDFSLPEIQIDNKRSRFNELSQQLLDPAIQSDYRQAGKLNTEYKQAEQVISLYDAIAHAIEEYKQLEELLADPEMAELAKGNKEELETKIPQLIAQLEDLTLPKLDNDENNAIFEIRAGTGGTEASLFAEEIYRMYLRYATEQGFKIESLSTSYNDEGGIKEVIFGVEGPHAYGKLRFESGVHRVQRVPATESSGRIHTSAISVVVLPEIESTDLQVDPKDLRIDVYRSSGPGGQSVNTTDSAVRITHIPSGIVVTCQDSKSQHKNKDKAMSILMSKLYAIEQEEKAKASKDIRAQAIQSGDRSAKIRTYNFPQGRITDHRVNLSWFNVSEVMEGNLDEIVPVVNLQLRREISNL
jgi:peptide chain release factor 1